MLLLGSLVFCVIVLSGVFAADEERKIGTLLRLTREGAGRQARIKVFCSFEVAVLGLLLCYLPFRVWFLRIDPSAETYSVIQIHISYNVYRSARYRERPGC